MERRLSKSNYLSGLQCVKKLWLEIYDPGRGTTADPFRQMILHRGSDIGERAREQFSGGVLVGAPYHDIDGALEETEKRLREGTRILFEPAFLYRGLFCRVDVLLADPEEPESRSLIEVKSTLDVQELQLPDAAVQKYILQGAGYPGTNTCIMHLNRECRYPELSNLFVIERVDDEIEEELAVVPKAASAFFNVLEKQEEPVMPIGDHCRSPYECKFMGYCWRDVPSPSVYNIRRLNRKKRNELMEQNIFGVFDIPDDYPLSPKEREQIELYRSGTPGIDAKSIRKELSALRFPLYFLDFETDNPAVPRYEGTGPYQQVPFQYSLHILHKSGKLEHREYLHGDISDPRRPLAERLASDLEAPMPGGTVIAYYAAFEKNVIVSLSKLFPDLAPVLLPSTKRLWDLLDIFKKHYRHPGFLGSNSLKSVLPVIVPDMSYASLDVRNGSEAQLAWNILIDPDSSGREKNNIDTALREYCRQDTLAMVKIYEELKKV